MSKNYQPANVQDKQQATTNRPAELSFTQQGVTYAFVQFVSVVAVLDERGNENLTDRARVGQSFGDHGNKVESITLNGDWFDILDAKGNAYRVPVTNVRSARR